MKKRYIDVVTESGLRYGRVVYVRSRRRRPVNIDRLIRTVVPALMYAWSLVLCATVTVMIIGTIV